MSPDSELAAHSRMEAPSRSSQKYLLLQVWCGILTVSLVAMAVFVASIRSKPEEVSFPDPNKLLPGFKNVKPDALSRMFESEEESHHQTSEFILPDSVRCAVTRLDLEKEVRDSLREVHISEACPKNRLFVPQEEDSGLKTPADLPLVYFIPFLFSPGLGHLDDPGWQEHVVCASCSLSLHQNSIYISNSSARSRFFIYAQVVFRRQKKHGLSVKLIRNPSPGKKEKTEAEVPAAEAGGLVWMGRIVSLNGGDSVRLNITGEYERDKTFWGAFQLL
ncbi:PREDICTED: uncharacterized protein LOC107104041 [Cyprinodon variegatus]|uniref:uncharacterized protein LOC107104041 n=1 Tax=Cyprinodon variegatus TaxID=28743 RepID=UPI000742B998|nr:PREDICTED: uncharacterized protein LOC107104041 [Cyprinodon variegatus]